MVLGVLLAVVGGSLFVGTAGSNIIATFTAQVRATPATFTMELDEGTYVVYEQKGLTPRRLVSITPSAVEVVSASGETIPAESMSVTETIDRNGGSFAGVARFTIDEPGLHRITVLGDGRQVFVAPSITGSILSALAWLGLIGVGLLAAALGLVLFIVGFVRGRRPEVAARVAGEVAPPFATPVNTPEGAPEGWFADPKGEARLRWWDGQQWTEHVS